MSALIMDNTGGIVPKEFFKVSEAAEFACLSEKEIRRKINTGALICSRIGRRIVIAKEDIRSFIAQHKQTGSRPKKIVRKMLKSA